MKPRKIKQNVYWLGAIDWDRRLFDSLIPLPDGTSYNAYLIKGSRKTALLDTVDPAMENILMSQLEDIPKIDYIIAHHAEQDHSGTIPAVLQKHEEAIVLCTPKAKNMLVDHLDIDPARIKTVEDGEELSLGGKTLRFIYTPWVHWPETMVTRLHEDRILFSCDFFGSHLASSALFAGEHAHVYEAAKRYYAEIMMPFRKPIQNNLKKISDFSFDFIAPSHGPVFNRPDRIISLYNDWVSDKTANLVVTKAYNKPGICVDTHVHRIANRWEYVRTKTPDASRSEVSGIKSQRTRRAEGISNTATISFSKSGIR